MKRPYLVTWALLTLGRLGAVSAAKAPAPLDLNVASEVELMRLPGVGRQRAGEIVQYRRQHRFRAPADIMRVRGFKGRSYVRLKPYLRVEPPGP